MANEDNADRQQDRPVQTLHPGIRRAGQARVHSINTFRQKPLGRLRARQDMHSSPGNNGDPFILARGSAWGVLESMP